MTPKYRTEDRLLERALLFNFFIHAVAMASMATLLLPAMPGGGTSSDAARVATIALHPTVFRLGWLPWQLCALSDGLLAIAMVRVRWIPKVPSILVLALTLAAIVPDQYAQLVWITKGVRLAEEGDVGAYLALERSIFPLTAGVGALLYTLAALGWTWSFAVAGTWSRALTILSVPLFCTMLIAVTAPLLPAHLQPGATFVSTANAIGFVELQVWLGLVTEEVLRRARPFESYGRLARWRYPRRGVIGWILDGLANSRLASALLEPLPEVTMRSDITDVIYVSYVIRAERVADLVPDGLELQRLGPNEDYALFTFLTYRHGHFGPALLGPLRELLPSPIHTNWRIHVVDPKTQHRGIYFITNAITSVIPALGARLTTEGMPMHVLPHAELSVERDTVRVVLDPQEGSGPDAKITAAVARAGARPSVFEQSDSPWRICFEDLRGFLEYCVPQDRAMSSQPLRGRVSRQEINLGIPIDRCELLEGAVESSAARAIAGDAPPLIFRVANVDFRFSIEAHDRRSEPPTSVIYDGGDG